MAKRVGTSAYSGLISTSMIMVHPDYIVCFDQLIAGADQAQEAVERYIAIDQQRHSGF